MTVPWHRIRDLLAEAVEQLPEERGRWLAENCPDEALRAEVASLLVSYDDTGSFDALLERALESPLLDANPLPDTIGPYRILERIGRGGMGDVFLAERDDPDFPQSVAIKVTRPSAGVDAEDLLRRFLTERRILAQLSHPNIARLYDGGVTDDGRPYFVMEHVQGEPLDDHCDRKDLDVRARVALLRTVCEAVQYAHEHLVVHRDIKPANILITDDGAPKLLDFGIAKVLEDDGPGGTDATRTELRRVSLDYASPEQLRGDPVTPATDVYSLGVLMYRILTGALPHELAGRTPAEIDGVVTGTPDPPSARVSPRSPERRRLQGDLDTITLMALRPDPGRRYPTAGHLAEDLARHLEHRPVRARPDSAAYRWRRFVRRHRVGVAAAAVAAAAVLSGAAVALWQADRAAEQARLAEAERARAEEQAATATAVSDFLAGLLTSSDPREALGAEKTATELLEEGRRRIAEDGELSDQPEIRATMLRTLGTVYRSRGDLETSRDLLTQALEVRRALADLDPESLASLLYALAVTEITAGRTEEASSLLSEAVELRSSAEVRDDAALAETLSGLANVQMRLGNMDSAEVLLGQEVEIHRAGGAETLERLAHTLDGLGIVARRTGRVELAEARYREALEIRQRALDERHPDLIRSYNNLSVALAGQRRYADAEPYLRRVLEAWTEVLGHEHYDVAVAKQNLAAVLDNLGQLDEAEPLYLDALEGKRRALGPTHPSTATTLGNLGGLHEVRGELDEAVRYYEMGLEAREASQGAGHPQVADVAHSLARTELLRGDSARARSLFERALAIRKDALLPQDDGRAATTLELTRLLLAAGEVVRAEEELRAVLDARSETDASSVILAHLRTAHGEALMALGRTTEAEETLLEARTTLREVVDAEGDGGEDALTRRPGDPPTPKELLRVTLERLAALYEGMGREADRDRMAAELREIEPGR
jgi:serine/threonine-protein kinase